MQENYSAPLAVSLSIDCINQPLAGSSINELSIMPKYFLIDFLVMRKNCIGMIAKIFVDCFFIMIMYLELHENDKYTESGKYNKI